MNFFYKSSAVEVIFVTVVASVPVIEGAVGGASGGPDSTANLTFEVVDSVSSLKFKIHKTDLNLLAKSGKVRFLIVSCVGWHTRIGMVGV